MRELLRDVKYEVRVCLRAPGYLAACVVTLALGIGATVVVFAVVDGALWRPLPCADADRIVQVQYHLPIGEAIVPLRVMPEELRECVIKPRPYPPRASLAGGAHAGDPGGARKDHRVPGVGEPVRATRDPTAPRP